MPELPEVEVLVRHLRERLVGQRIREVDVFRTRTIRPTDPEALRVALIGARFVSLERRGKFMLFTWKHPRKPAKLKDSTVLLVGHLGMTGRMFVTASDAPLPRHVPVRLQFDGAQMIFEDPRYFGRLTLDASALENLGPEPWDPGFNGHYLKQALKRCVQPIKVKLLDQSLVTGVGNIYASEALFRARISPRLPAKRLKEDQLERLTLTIREVLEEAIRFGSTLALDFAGEGSKDGLFYYGSSPDPARRATYEERLQVYDREGRACYQCQEPIRRVVQAARSTFYCPQCQPAR